MNKLVLAALAATLATSVSAKEELTVTANPSFSAWIDAATRTLGVAFEKVNLSRSETGITYVRFNTDENGKPENIATVTSGERKPNLQRIGRKAIGNIRTLHPLYDGAKPNMLVEAAIVVADDQDQLDGLLAKVHERARLQNARVAASGVVNPVVSLAVVSGF